MDDKIEKFFDDMTYKSAQSLSKMNPELLADYCAEVCIKADRLEKEVARLKKYEMLVQYIANDYWELSHDKIKWIYTDYKKRCRQLIEEDNE